MLVKTFCDDANPLFSEEFYDCLPKYCPDCGMPMEMSETLTGLHCSGVRCPSKVVQRLVSMANQLGVKDLGESRADKFIKQWKISNPLFIFAYNPDEDGQLAPDIGLEVSKRIAKQFQDKNTFTLAEYVKIANLPNVQSSAFEIFGEFDDIEKAYEAIESGGVDYIRDKLNIKSKDNSEVVSVRALKVFESLMTFKDDLISCVKYVKITEINNGSTITIKAVCSDEVGEPFRTKADFYATCNNAYSDIHIEFGNSVTKKTEYLVWKGADGSTARLTNKVKKARAYQDKGEDIKIVTALEFLNILKNLSGFGGDE